MSSLTHLETSNKRIVQFYKNNPAIHFEAVNLIFIDLFDKLLTDMNSTMNSTVNGQILLSMNENTQLISQLRDSFSSLKSDIANDVVVKICDIQKDYVEDVKHIIHNNNSDKLGPLLEKNNNLLLDKTAIILNDVLPKSQSQIRDTIQHFHKSISEDTTQMLKTLDQHSIKDFVSSFEMKSATMLQPLFSFISSSEDRINHNINCLKDISNTKIPGESGFKKSSHTLNHILSQQYTTADIVNISSFCGSNSTLLMKRQYKPTLVLQSATSDNNITAEETKQFIQMIDEQRCCGIFISHNSGIASKPNFHIDIHNGFVVVYIHNLGDSHYKIQIAVDIIDNLSAKLKLFNHNHCDTSISKELLDEMNKDFQMFVTQKESIIGVIKDMNKKLLSQLDDLKFSSLEKYLSTKFAPTHLKVGLKCELCKHFTANNLKALAAHKRGCVRKNAALCFEDKENVAIVVL